MTEISNAFCADPCAQQLDAQTYYHLVHRFMSGSRILLIILRKTYSGKLEHRLRQKETGEMRDGICKEAYSQYTQNELEYFKKLIEKLKVNADIYIKVLHFEENLSETTDT